MDAPFCCGAAQGVAEPCSQSHTPPCPGMPPVLHHLQRKLELRVMVRVGN